MNQDEMMRVLGESGSASTASSSTHDEVRARMDAIARGENPYKSVVVEKKPKEKRMHVKERSKEEQWKRKMKEVYFLHCAIVAGMKYNLIGLRRSVWCRIGDSLGGFGRDTIEMVRAENALRIARDSKKNPHTIGWLIGVADRIAERRAYRARQLQGQLKDMTEREQRCSTGLANTVGNGWGTWTLRCAYWATGFNPDVRGYPGRTWADHQGQDIIAQMEALVGTYGGNGKVGMEWTSLGGPTRDENLVVSIITPVIELDNGREHKEHKTAKLGTFKVTYQPYTRQLRVDLEKDMCPGKRRTSHIHPHVSTDHHLCVGEGEAAMNAAKGREDITSIFEIATSILQTYNPNNPYAPLRRWWGEEGVEDEDEDEDRDRDEENQLECGMCGYVGNEDNMSCCSQCGMNLCEECGYYCEDCEETHCGRCEGTELYACVKCGNYTCSRVVRKCSTGGCRTAYFRRCGMYTCEVCEETTCDDHMIRCAGCASPVCIECSVICHVCDRTVCPECEDGGVCNECKEE